jgi:hypothetical protein
MMLDHHLIDLLPDEIVPTWRNGRSGLDSISKCLDRVLASESLLNDVGRFRSWVDLPFVSDHAPVVAQFDFQQFLMAYPFKLNPSWLNEADFTPIVSDVWRDPDFLLESDVQIRFVWKLKVLKAQIKSWART